MSVVLVLNGEEVKVPKDDLLESPLLNQVHKERLDLPFNQEVFHVYLKSLKQNSQLTIEIDQVEDTILLCQHIQDLPTLEFITSTILPQSLSADTALPLSFICLKYQQTCLYKTCLDTIFQHEVHIWEKQNNLFYSQEKEFSLKILESWAKTGKKYVLQAYMKLKNIYEYREIILEEERKSRENFQEGEEIVKDLGQNAFDIHFEYDFGKFQIAFNYFPERDIEILLALQSSVDKYMALSYKVYLDNIDYCGICIFSNEIIRNAIGITVGVPKTVRICLRPLNLYAAVLMNLTGDDMNMNLLYNFDSLVIRSLFANASFNSEDEKLERILRLHENLDEMIEVVIWEKVSIKALVRSVRVCPQLAKSYYFSLILRKELINRVYNISEEPTGVELSEHGASGKCAQELIEAFLETFNEKHELDSLSETSACEPKTSSVIIKPPTPELIAKKSNVMLSTLHSRFWANQKKK